MKANIATTIITQVIALSQARCAQASSSDLSGKYPSIRDMFSEGKAPFGCQTSNVAKVIEGITGYNPAVVTHKVLDLQVVKVKSGSIDGQLGIVLSFGPSGATVWSPSAPSDTWALALSSVTPVSKADAKPLWAAIKSNKAAFLKVAKNHLSLGGLGLV